jgi:hypothetical protein
LIELGVQEKKRGQLSLFKKFMEEKDNGNGEDRTHLQAI